MPVFQAVIAAALDKNTPETDYARHAAAALRGLGVDATVFDTSTLPLGTPDAANAALLHRRLRDIRPPGIPQIYCNLVPDMRFGNTSIAGHLAYRSLQDPGLRVVNYVYEFAEGVRRYGEVLTMALQMQQYPVGLLSRLATTTEFEARLLGHYLTFPKRFSLLPLLVPRLRHTRVIPLPPIIEPSPAVAAGLAGKFSRPGPLRMVVLGGFRPFKGINPESGLGLYHFLDALAARVHDGALPESLELHVAGRCFDTSQVEAIPGGNHAPFLRCIESLYRPDDRARELTAAWLESPTDAPRARRLEDHLRSSCPRYPFAIHLHLDRDNAWLSEHVLAPAHLGLLLSLRGVSCRNSVFTNFVAHHIPVLANCGEEVPGHLRPHLIPAYEEAEREAALAAGRLEPFLTEAMEKAAGTCASLLRDPASLVAKAAGLYDAMGRPSTRNHAVQLVEWFESVLADPVSACDRRQVALVWPLTAPVANWACRDLVNRPHAHRNPLQRLVDGCCRIGLLQSPLSRSWPGSPHAKDAKGAKGYTELRRLGGI